MANIHVLNPEISNKIAAGEVVERPASVVKELVENSIDAGAKNICVEIKNGGISLISVTDNGCGMHSEDAQIAFLRHATSKIQSEEDLDAIYTLGFRGEALSSIGAVSEAVIYTKRREDAFGTVVTCEGGEIIASDEGGMSDGTKVVVRNLFYNTPARMKFLKKDATEAGYITDLIARFILAHPEISFRLIKNGKDVLSSSGDGNLKNAVYAVYGKDYANNIIAVDYEAEGIRVTGAIGNSSLSRPNRSFQSFFVNKRTIKSPLIIKALEEAFKNQIMIGKFPVAILNIEINPSLIDINVHPTKLEVKFSDDKKIYDAVYYAVKNSLYAIPGEKQNKTNYNPRINPFILAENKPATLSEESVKTDTKKVSENNISSPVILKAPETKPVQTSEIKPQITVTVKEDPLECYRKKETESKPAVFKTPEFEIKIEKKEDFVPCDTKVEAKFDYKQTEISTQTELPAESLSENNISIDTDDFNFKIIGQIFDTYIIAQKDNEMLLIDQHAAHERIKYEQLLKNLEAKQIYSQMLLEPVVVKLSTQEFSAFEQNIDVLQNLGFEAEEFGELEIIVRSAPQELDWSDIEDVIIELLSEISSSKKDIITEKIERMIYTIACKAAVKANHVLNESEMKGLLNSVFALENINTCPHGRPITVKLTKKELEKMFKRIV